MDHMKGEDLADFSDYLQSAAEWVNRNNEAHGWYDPDPAQVDGGVSAVFDVFSGDTWREQALRDVVTEVIRAVGRTFGDEIALLVSEAGEALDAYRKTGMEDQTQGPPHTMVKPEGTASELADIFVRLLDTCNRYDVNLGEEFIKKMRYNETRPYRHGGKRL